MKHSPPLVMQSPNSRIILERSQPSPALSGQFTVMTEGSSGILPCWINTTSSQGMPISWAELRREEREREVPNDFNAPTLPRSYISIYSSSSSSLQSWALLLRRRVADRSMGLAGNGLYSILVYCTVFLWLWHSDEIINILGFLPFFQNRGSQTQKKKSLSAWWSPPDS